MGRFALEMQCRLYLARIAVLERNAQEALRLLDQVPADGERVLGQELQAMAHYWRSQALTLRGDQAGALAEKQVARQLVEAVASSLADQAWRRGFLMRPDIHMIVE